MSRTFRTNKYGEIKTDKFKKDFNGCGCAYCEFINTDFRNKHVKTYLDNEIKEASNYLENRYEEYWYDYNEEEYHLDEISSIIMKENNKNK